MLKVYLGLDPPFPQDQSRGQYLTIFRQPNNTCGAFESVQVSIGKCGTPPWKAALPWGWDFARTDFPLPAPHSLLPTPRSRPMSSVLRLPVLGSFSCFFCSPFTVHRSLSLSASHSPLPALYFRIGFYPGKFFCSHPVPAITMPFASDTLTSIAFPPSRR
jgi:hypothetical protein